MLQRNFRERLRYKIQLVEALFLPLHYQNKFLIMPYIIESKNKEKVVLKRKPFKGKVFIYLILWTLTIIGSLILLLSLFDDTEDGLKFKYVSLLITSLGILGIYSFKSYLKAQKIILPET